jgi:hypothetical protein
VTGPQKIQPLRPSATYERARAMGAVLVDRPTWWAMQLRVPVELVVDVESSFAALPEADL